VIRDWRSSHRCHPPAIPDTGVKGALIEPSDSDWTEEGGVMAKAKRKKCDCRSLHLMRDRAGLIDAYRTIIARSYTREEFRAVVRWSKAAMLPRDGG
jgi:hypothetical protein